MSVRAMVLFVLTCLTVSQHRWCTAVTPLVQERMTVAALTVTDKEHSYRCDTAPARGPAAMYHRRQMLRFREMKQKLNL
jgi:hypothetical protein